MSNTIDVAAIVLEGDAVNNEILNCPVILKDNAVNANVINGDVIIEGTNAVNSGTINGDVQCANPQSVGGTIAGNKFVFVPGLNDTSAKKNIIKAAGTVTQNDDGGGIRSATFGSNTYIKTKNKLSFDLSESDFTIEFWLKPSLDASNQVILAGYPDTSSKALQIYIDTDDKLHINNGNASTGANIPLTAGAWVHIALVCHNQVSRVYVNGARSVRIAQKFAPIRYFKIGNKTGSNYLKGSLTGLHVVRKALYSVNFTVPNTLTEIQPETELLLNFGATAMPSVSPAPALNGYYADGYFVNGVRQAIAAGPATDEPGNVTLENTENHKYYNYTTEGATPVTGVQTEQEPDIYGGTIYTAYAPRPINVYVWYGHNSSRATSACGLSQVDCDPENLGTTAPINMRRAIRQGQVSLGQTRFRYYDYGPVAAPLATPQAVVQNKVYYVDAGENESVSNTAKAGARFYTYSYTMQMYMGSAVQMWSPDRYSTPVGGTPTAVGFITDGFIDLSRNDNKIYNALHPHLGTRGFYYFPVGGQPYLLEGLHNVPGSVDIPGESAKIRWRDISGTSYSNPQYTPFGRFSSFEPVTTAWVYPYPTTGSAVDNRCYYYTAGGTAVRPTGVYLSIHQNATSNSDTLTYSGGPYASGVNFYYFVDGVIDREFTSTSPIKVENYKKNGADVYCTFADGVGTPTVSVDL